MGYYECKAYGGDEEFCNDCAVWYEVDGSDCFECYALGVSPFWCYWFNG